MQSQEMIAADYRRQSQKQVSDVMIKQLGGFCLTQFDGPNESLIDVWNIDGKIVITQTWKDGGWEYYLQGKCYKVDEIAESIKGYFK